MLGFDKIHTLAPDLFCLCYTALHAEIILVCIGVETVKADTYFHFINSFLKMSMTL